MSLSKSNANSHKDNQMEVRICIYFYQFILDSACTYVSIYYVYVCEGGGGLSIIDSISFLPIFGLKKS